MNTLSESKNYIVPSNIKCALIILGGNSASTRTVCWGHWCITSCWPQSRLPFRLCLSSPQNRMAINNAVVVDYNEAFLLNVILTIDQGRAVLSLTSALHFDSIFTFTRTRSYAIPTSRCEEHYLFLFGGLKNTVSVSRLFN